MPDPTPPSAPATAPATPPSSNAGASSGHPGTLPPTPAASAPTLAEKFAAVKQAAKAPPPGSAPPSRAEGEGGGAVPDSDPDLVEVQRILDADRRNREESKRVAAARAAFEAERVKARSELEAARLAREAVVKKDGLAALRALGFTDDDIYKGDDSILFRIADAKVKEPETSEAARLEQVVEAKLEEKAAAERAAQKDAAEKAAEIARKEQEAAETVAFQAKESYSKNVLEIVEKSPEKYRALTKHGITAGAVAAYAWNVLVDSRGAVDISEEEALADMETHYRELSRAVFEEETPTPPKPEPHRPMSINPNWQATSPGPARPTPTTLKGKFEALKERARKEGGPTARR